ncbi:hypothetical protein BaRGS_00039615 [Batillaria attramentaria]|uniref:Uncharacterized protein n=1 Tax=Batillaria attramentaria TaxID=370345 RepID=A0ABD0J2P9_9CAEN
MTSACDRPLIPKQPANFLQHSDQNDTGFSLRYLVPAELRTSQSVARLTDRNHSDYLNEADEQKEGIARQNARLHTPGRHSDNFHTSIALVLAPLRVNPPGKCR